jgi:hypothetical protein
MGEPFLRSNPQLALPRPVTSRTGKEKSVLMRPFLLSSGASMARKKSIKKSAKEFSESVKTIADFFTKTSGLKDEFYEWCTDYAITRLYRDFETLMLDALSGAINNDASTLSSTVGLDFPKHLSLDVCRYIIVGSGYFDFKGRDGLIGIAREYVPDTHYLVKILKDAEYKNTLERLSAFRNFAAHNSKKAKAAARKATGGERIRSAGSWLKKQDRFTELCKSLEKLAAAIERKAPY